MQTLYQTTIFSIPSITTPEMVAAVYTLRRLELLTHSRSVWSAHSNCMPRKIIVKPLGPKQTPKSRDCFL